MRAGLFRAKLSPVRGRWFLRTPNVVAGGIRHTSGFWDLLDNILFWLVLALGILLLVEILLQVVYVPLILRQFEAQPPFNVVNHPSVDRAERVEFTTADGVRLRGSLMTGNSLTPRGLVLFCPEVGGTHWSSGWYCRGLVDAGFDVLSFDFRNQGESDSLPGYTPTHWPTRHELTDVDAAIDFIQSRSDLRTLPLVLMGISRGSIIALHTASRVPYVRAVCGEGTYSVDALLEHFVLRWAQLYLPPWALRLIPMWHLRLTLRMVRWISACRRHVRYAILEPSLAGLRGRPVLLISGERDNYVPPSIIRGLARRIASPLCRIWSVPRAKHNQAREVDSRAFDQTVEEFFSLVCPAVQRTSVQDVAVAAR